jgi:hypothetical protein
MEATGCAFLKEKETPATSGIPHIVDELMNKLFVVDDNKEAPHQPPHHLHTRIHQQHLAPS